MRRGVSLLEVLIAATILVIGLVPIMGYIQSAARDARLYEFHTQALVRARGLLEAARTLGPTTFEKALQGKDEVRVPVNLPLEAPRGDKDSGPRVDTLLSRMSPIQEGVSVRRVARHGPSALYELRARVEWRLVTDSRRAMTVEVATLVGDPLLTIHDVGGEP